MSSLPTVKQADERRKVVIEHLSKMPHDKLVEATATLLSASQNVYTCTPDDLASRTAVGLQFDEETQQVVTRPHWRRQLADAFEGLGIDADWEGYRLLDLPAKERRTAMKELNAERAKINAANAAKKGKTK